MRFKNGKLCTVRYKDFDSMIRVIIPKGQRLNLKYCIAITKYGGGNAYALILYSTFFYRTEMEKRIEEAAPAGQQLQELGMRLRCDDTGSENDDMLEEDRLMLDRSPDELGSNGNDDDLGDSDTDDDLMGETTDGERIIYPWMKKFMWRELSTVLIKLENDDHIVSRQLSSHKPQVVANYSS
ncbi:unnamed protein product [Ceratitis capitata]|uniref:(Mediterranean fruit fly) hypothetical protein n=1 Tax=Ceratitis capitata TaxID=7213 RepID=A0A811U6H1_CERCA|nr:unnamed protein product [Ceratitis capitata]